jgi:FkbM family methyltransferase
MLNWRADVVVQAGVGQRHQEVDVLTEEWPGVRFIGFEPYPLDPKEYNGQLYPSALGCEIGHKTLHVKKRHKDGASLHPFDADVTTKEIPIDVTTLDWFIRQTDNYFLLRKRLLLWLDCEGSELDVLRGAKEFIEYVNVVNVEITAKPPSPKWNDPLAVHYWLVEHGFIRQWIHTQNIASGQFDAIYVRPYLFKPEYCCDPWSKV